MNKDFLKNDYLRKLNDFMVKHLEGKQNVNILEFGVRKGISTKIFLDICRKNSSKLYSIDVDNYSHVFEDSNWKFIHARDDDFEEIEKITPEKFELIYLDSYHEPNHVEKIIYHYYPKLNINGYYIIDDICWLPYVKKSYRDNFGCEIANIETFERILEIFYSNFLNFDLEFTFVGSGLAKIKKLNNNELRIKKKIPSRKNSLKNIFKKIIS